MGLQGKRWKRRKGRKEENIEKRKRGKGVENEKSKVRARQAACVGLQGKEAAPIRRESN